MKHPEIKITIAEPCHENWNKMKPTEKGKFCNVCTKEVIDFSAKSDEEIISYLSKNNNLCGRFHKSQLDRKLIADRKKRNHWLSYAASLLLPITLFSQEKLQKKGEVITTEKVDNSNFKSLQISSLQRKNTTVENRKIIITGTVTEDAGMPLPAASVVIKGTNIGKATDFDGMYTITVKEGDEIDISYVGYITKTIKIVKDTSVYNVKLEPSGELEECVVVGGFHSSHNDYYETEETKERKKRTKNYFEFKKKKRLEKRAKRRAEKAKRTSQNNTSNN